MLLVVLLIINYNEWCYLIRWWNNGDNDNNSISTLFFNYQDDKIEKTKKYLTYFINKKSTFTILHRLN